MACKVQRFSYWTPSGNVPLELYLILVVVPVLHPLNELVHGVIVRAYSHICPGGQGS